VPGRPEIFAVGDTAAVTDAKGRPVPGNAPAAKQMGRHAGRVIAARLAGTAGPGPFAYRHHGDLATIGRRAAVASMDGVKLTGWLGWWFWGIAHVWYLIGFRSRVVVSFEWLWSYLTFQRGARLITGDGAPVPREATAPPVAANDRVPFPATRDRADTATRDRADTATHDHADTATRDHAERRSA
jgi:NADH dehydrogenase